jgi:curved DNA-binding protein CbpA
MSGQSSRPDLYAVLGVPPDATQALIDHAYRTLVRRYHPDSRGATDAGQASSDDASLRHVMAAYRVIGNPDRRADYDQRSPNPLSPGGTVSVRVRTPPTNDGALVTAGPAYWNPAPSTRPTPQRDITADAVGRASRARGSRPQTPSGGPVQSHWRAAGMTAEAPTPVRGVSELVEALTAEVNQLRIARDSNRRIGMAMGIVMNQRHVTDTQAFDILRGTSQNTNRKLRDVAEDVIGGRRT